ncbi:hypothetical protein ACFWF3_33950, partial [Nocardia sp. NPDC060220]|uniref:hypothetical protein n=1 Tax=Nocardia sp. NPDC060220 TaxID=3347076 RepID=UPI0036471645
MGARTTRESPDQPGEDRHRTEFGSLQRRAIEHISALHLRGISMSVSMRHPLTAYQRDIWT